MTRRSIFFAMPNDGSCEHLWQTALEPAAEKVGGAAVRIRPHPERSEVLSKMTDRIFDCDVFVAIAFARNANVFLEIGLAIALQKPCLILAADIATAEFFQKAASVLLVKDQHAISVSQIEEELRQMIAVAPGNTVSDDAVL